MFGAAFGAGILKRLCSDYAIRFNNGSRNFTAPANPDSWHIWVFFNDAGATYGPHRLIIDGVELAESSNSSPTSTPNLLNESTLIGISRANTNTFSTPFTGLIAEIVFLPSYSVAQINYHGQKLASIYGLTWTTFAG